MFQGALGRQFIDQFSCSLREPRSCRRIRSQTLSLVHLTALVSTNPGQCLFADVFCVDENPRARQGMSPHDVRELNREVIEL